MYQRLGVLALATLAAAGCSDGIDRYLGQFEGTLTVTMTSSGGRSFTAVVGDILLDGQDLTGDSSPSDLELVTQDGDWQCIMRSDDAGAARIRLDWIEGCEVTIGATVYELDATIGHAERVGDELRIELTGNYAVSDPEEGGAFTSAFAGVPL